MAQSGKLKRKVLLFIVTFFGTGLISKKMPGTVGSLVATLVLIILPKSSVLVASMFVTSLFIGWLCCKLYIPRYDTDRDPRYIVIDEACGIFLGATLIYCCNHTSHYALLVNFLLFRLFDIAKPYPIRNIETSMKTRIETVAIGIMLDDILAAIFAATIQITLYKVL